MAQNAEQVPIERAHAARKKAKSAAARREQTIRAHRWLRYAIQIVFFILAPGLFSGAFNGVKYLFTQIGATQSLEMNSFVVLLIAALAFTVVFGRFFCGYACAFGTLGDIVYAAFEFLRSKTPLPRIELADPLVRALSLVKYVVLAGICVACVFGAWSSVSGMSPWVAFAGFTSGSLDNIDAVAFVLLAFVVVGMAVRERFFCQFLCPMGAVFSLMPVLGFSEFSRMREHCAKNCGRCHDACPVDIWPDANEMGHGECISCGRCADVCPMCNVNFIAIEKQLNESVPKGSAAELPPSHSEQGPKAGVEISHAAAGGSQKSASRPLRKTKEKWHLLRGTETGVIVAKALALIAVCWAVGSTRYLPTFIDVFGQSVWPF